MNTPIASATCSAGALLRWQFTLAHQLLDTTMKPFSAEASHWRLLGAASPVGIRYAQIVVCEDLSINGILAAGTPLALSTWAGRTGLSELPPLNEPMDRRDGHYWRDWAHRVQLNPAQLRRYTQAVYAATDAYLAALPDDALSLASNEQPVRLLSALLLTLAMRRGEIACLLALDRQPMLDETESV